jgi:hypothetical protein
MTVAASIILAAIVGGVIFVLLDSWQRRAATPAPAAPRPVEPTWQAPPPRHVKPVEPRPRPTWERPDWDHDDRWDDQRPGNLWSGWADRERRRPQ